MLRFHRWIFILPACSVVLCLIPAVSAASGDAAAAVATAPSSAAPGVTATALPPELQAELDALLSAGSWNLSNQVRGSLGWRDNVLLSAFAPVERSFVRAELESILIRPIGETWQVVAFLNGDVLRYFSPPAETSGEQQWSLHNEVRWQALPSARLAVKGGGYFSDTVVDLSESEVERVVAPTRVRGAYAIATTQLSLPGQLRFDPAFHVRRVDYREYAGDYDEVRAGGRLEWGRPRGAWAIGMGWFDSRRSYDQRIQFTAGGRALPGTRLRFRQRDGDVRVRFSTGMWSVAATAGRFENRDEASGYFDYNRKRARLEVGWEGSLWRVSLDAEARRTEYRVQTVGAGIAPPPRIADDYDLLLRTERDLDERWTLFAEHRWERSRANEADFSYRANTVLAGVQRSF